MKKIINAGLVLILIALLALGNGEAQRAIRAEKRTEALRERAVREPAGGEPELRSGQEPDDGGPEAEPAEAAGEDTGTQVDFVVLEAVNPDIRGWLRIPGTGIDEPILIGEDGKYLNRNFEGKPDPEGAVFSYAGTDLQKNPRIWLFGHNLLSGRMFGKLKKYLDDSYAGSHREAFVSTREGTRRYRLRSVSVCREEELAGFPPPEGGQILTLVTCRGGAGTPLRLVVEFQAAV